MTNEEATRVLREMLDDCVPEGALWRALGSVIDGTSPEEHERYEREMVERYDALTAALAALEDRARLRERVPALLNEIIRSHRDPESPDYNECDEAQCAWCDDALAVLDAIDAGET